MGVHNNQLGTNLPQLQNLIKRDPESYTEEFLQQLRHFESALQIFLLNPAADAKEFGELVNFMSHVGGCYPQQAGAVPGQVMALLDQHAAVMQPDVRRDLARSVMLMRARDTVTAIAAFGLFFKLFRIKDKVLREMLYTHVVGDIKRLNHKAKNNALNKTLQNFMYTMVQDDDATAAHQSLKVMVDLYRKDVWRDARTVNVIATACFSPHTKVMVAALQFFLGADEALPENDDSDDDGKPDLRELAHGQRVGKKTKSRQRQMDRARATLKRAERRERAAGGDGHFSALMLIHDAQGMAERLFTQLRKSTDRFDVRLIMMNVISRLIGAHDLVLLNFYPFITKYMQPKQKDVTKILAYAAQASHELVPPDAMEPVIQAIANNFVTERCSGEVMTVGLNAMRVICARCPLAMSSTLLQDLVQYRTYKDKSVMMAARALMQLFRALNPTLLARKDRGKAAAEDADYVAAEYGQQRVVDHVPGAEVVAAADTAGDDGDDGWEVASDSDDDSDGEWVAVSHSEGEGEGEEEGEADPTDQSGAGAGDEGEAGAGAAERAKAVSMTRLLTPADFAAIKKARVQEALDPGARRKRKAAGNETGAGAGDGTALGSKDAAVSVDDIERLHKKQKMDREARIAALQANKGEKDKWLSKKQMRKEAREIGTTNTDKKKSKNYTMVQHGKSVRRKNLLSQLEKTTRARNQKRKEKKRRR